MKKTKEREVIEPGAFVKKFCSNYISILIIVLVLTDICFKANNYENVVLIRGGAMAFAIIIGVMATIVGLSKKYIVRKNMKDFYIKYVAIAVIAIAFLSILYFMYCVKSEVNEIKDSSEYKMAKSIYGTKYTDKVLEDAADEARKGWYSIWGIMLGASAITIPITKKLLDNYSEDYEGIATNVSSNMGETEDTISNNNK